MLQCKYNFYVLRLALLWNLDSLNLRYAWINVVNRVFYPLRYFSFNLCVCVSVWVCTCMYRHPQRPKEGIRFPGAGATGGFEPPSVGAGNQTLVLLKNSKLS